MAYDLPHPVAAAARARPDHPALVAGDARLTFAALADRIARRAGALAALDIGPGRVVALDAPQTIDGWVDLWAIGWLGAAAAPIDPQAPAPARQALFDALGSHVRLVGGGSSNGEAAPERPWPLDEVRLIVATSGTTGRPTPVRLTAGQLVFSAMGSALRLGHRLDDRWLGCLPTHHIGGLSVGLRCALYGVTAELMPFDPKAVAARLDSGDISLISLTPSMLTAVLDARPMTPFPPRLRVILLGGARSPEGLLARCRAIAAPVATTWGMTEAASQIATRAPGDFTPGAPPLAFARVAAEPDGGLRVEGPIVGGRLLTADRGRIEGGRVVVEGRRDDVIISGGVNLSPGAIEDALRGHPAVTDAAVLGVPDDRWGQRPAAAVVLQPGAGPLDALRPTLRARCQADVGPYAAPDRFVAVDALPRDPLGKLRRARLTPLFADAALERDAARPRSGKEGAP